MNRPVPSAASNLHRMTSHAKPSPPPPSASGMTVGDVDASFRTVALCFVAKSIVWLILASVLLLLASVKLHAPAMMSKSAWLTYGRLAPAGWDALVYGFASQSAFAVGLWVLARGSMQRLQQPLLVFVGSCFWNLGTLAGIVGILAGYSTGREWLEMPAGAMACLVMGAGLMGAAGWLTFSARTETQTYPSAWFVLLALLSFVWFGTVALMMLSSETPVGILQVLVQRWYANGVLQLFLGSIGLAVVFHFLPQWLNRPLASRQLALMSFWCLACFAPWAVTEHGDPFPRWIVSAGLAGQFFAAVGILATGINWWKTSEGCVTKLMSTLSGRLLVVAALSYLAGGAIDFLLALQRVSAWSRFTWTHTGLEWLLVAGAVGLGLFAVLPELISHTSGRTLAPRWVGLHAVLSIVGVLLTALPLIFGGWFQGARMADPTMPFIDALRSSMHFVRLSSLGLVIFLVAQLALAVAFAGLVKEMAMGWLATLKSWSIPTPKDRTAGARS